MGSKRKISLYIIPSLSFLLDLNFKNKYIKNPANLKKKKNNFETKRLSPSLPITVSAPAIARSKFRVPPEDSGGDEVAVQVFSS